MDGHETEGTGLERATRRRGGRRRARQSRQKAPTERYRRLTNPFEPMTVLSEDEVAHIHESAKKVLAESGIRILLKEGRIRLREAGASVDETELMVRLDPEMVEHSLSTAPSAFDAFSRSTDRTVSFGGKNVVMVPVAGPPFVMDLAGGRRAGTLVDYDNFVKLSQHFDVIHTMGAFVEPQDVPMEFRHLDTGLSQLLHSDKLPTIYSRGRARMRDSLELVRIANGVSQEEFSKVPRCWSTINTNSPRQLDVPMCLGIIDLAEAGQVTLITPFTLAGAMTPITLAGALTLQHAEALAGVTLSQTVREGAPVIYGAFTSNVDMRSGAPAFGTPEAVKAAYASGQLARHVQLPWRSSAVNTSNTTDAQAGYETMMNMVGAAFGGANMILHAAGWLDSGLAASFEKFILDIEMVQMFAELFQPLHVSPDEVALDVIDSVEPGGHFFGEKHTLDRYDGAFYEPLVFSRTNFEQWTELGSMTADQRASSLYRTLLDDFESPAMEESVRAELADFVARRKAEGGAMPDD